MSLHLITEPAGTLMTGWKLVPKRTCRAADVRNDDDIPLDVACVAAPAENAGAGNAGQVDPVSRWEESERKLGKVR